MPDAGKPERWYKGKPLTADNLNDTPGLLEKLQFDVRNLQRAAAKPRPSPVLVWPVKMTGSASGGGKYTGKLLDAPTKTLTASGDLAEDDIGVEGADCYIFFSGEVAKSTHDLQTSGFLPLVFVGLFRGFADDGKYVFVTDGAQWEDCGP